MSHNNHMMNNQHQAQMINSSSVASSGSQVPQRNMMPLQRGGSQALNTSKSPYQVQSAPISQFSHLQQQQQQLVNNYHKQKQMSPDISSHQFPSTACGGMPSHNGNYQSIAGNSLHSSMGLDNGQLGLKHQHHPYPSQQSQSHQSSMQQHHYQTQQQPSTQQQQQQQQQQSQQPYQSFQQHHMIQQQHQQQQQSSQQSMHQQQQHLQMQQHIQQRNLNQQQQQQQRYQKPQSQPKQILQHSPAQGKSLSASQGSPVQPAITILSNQQQNSAPQSATVTNGQAGVDETTRATTADKTPQILSNVDNDSGQASDSQDSASNASETQSLANTKEKTPMCLINELARFNKMNHQYTLVDEQGPAHKKTFYVKLKLGEEEYSASGESIKKAQHAAAAIALADTKYQHPPPKPARLGSCNLEKTVELNALAMKRGEAAVYKSIEPQQPPYYHQPNMDFRGLYNQRYHQYMRPGGRDPRYRGGGVLWPLRYHYPRMNRAFYVSLRVGHREFIGDGPTRQAARHNAAQKALRILKNLPVQNSDKKSESEEVEEADSNANPEDTDDSLKSEISLVHEIALRRNMVVQFEVTRETGPPHMKNFVTRCTVSDMLTEGEGNSKKTSKKKAAELMLEELRKLPPLAVPTFPRPKSKIQINKKKNRNLIKSELQQQKADPNYGVGINPISRLIQIMQAQKKKEPVYTLVTERGLPRRREFIVQVEVEEKTCTGSGPNKKLAKRAAAEAMLQVLGYTKPSPQPTKSSFKNSAAGEPGQANGDKKVTFVEGDSPGGGDEKVNTTSNQQRVPGLLHLPTKTTTSSSSAANSPHSSASKEPAGVNLASILKPNLRPEIQLRELCKAMDCQLEIDDFTKKRTSGTEHITRITIGSSDNPQNFHGSNTTLESSRDMAALDALKVLVARAKDIHPGGDGPQMKKEVLTRSGPGLKKDFSK